MQIKKTSIVLALVLLLCAVWLFLESRTTLENRPEDIKIALRDVGHKVLLANNDSLSLVLPIKQLEESKYQLTFQNDFSIQPDSLVTIIKQSFKNSNLPRRYVVEVIQCADNEIAYSYKMRNEKDTSIIPCGRRTIPQGCYAIQAQFLNTKGSFFNKNILLAIIGLLVLPLLLRFFKSNKAPNTAENNKHHITIGDYIFYPNQNTLALKRKELQLSKKEGELLSILASHLNQVVRREDLTKQVWEDHGVIVGRSLDTYISKLRKRFIEDESIKLINVHGVGYKLEIG